MNDRHSKEKHHFGYYMADVINTTDFFSFGSQMPGRVFNAPDYRFGMNGQEKDDEISGVSGANYTAYFWEYDSRTGKRWNREPFVKHWESPYATFSNNPIFYSDPSGAQSEGSDDKDKKSGNNIPKVGDTSPNYPGYKVTNVTETSYGSLGSSYAIGYGKEAESPAQKTETPKSAENKATALASTELYAKIERAYNVKGAIFEQTYEISPSSSLIKSKLLIETTGYPDKFEILDKPGGATIKDFGYFKTTGKVIGYPDVSIPDEFDLDKLYSAGLIQNNRITIRVTAGDVFKDATYWNYVIIAPVGQPIGSPTESATPILKKP